MSLRQECVRDRDTLQATARPPRLTADCVLWAGAPWAGSSVSNISYLRKRQVGAAARNLTPGWMKLCGGKLLNYLLRGQLISSPFYWWSCTWMCQEMSRTEPSMAPSFSNAAVYFQYLIYPVPCTFCPFWKWNKKSEAMQCAAATTRGLTDSIWCSVRTERPPPSLRSLTRKEGEGMSLCSSVQCSHRRCRACACVRVYGGETLFLDVTVQPSQPLLSNTSLLFRGFHRRAEVCKTRRWTSWEGS